MSGGASSEQALDSFQRRLREVRRLIEQDQHRRRVLTLCEQAEPRSFDDYSSSGSFRRLEKFESSTYSEVLKAVDLANNNKPVVMKIMRALSKGLLKMLPSLTSKGCQSYNDILNELVVTQALSQLHDGVLLNGHPHALYRTPFFCLIHEIKVVSGNLERTLSRSSQAKARQEAEQSQRAGSSDARDKQQQQQQQQQNLAQQQVLNSASLDPVAPSFAEARRQFEQEVEKSQASGRHQSRDAFSDALDEPQQARDQSATQQAADARPKLDVDQRHQQQQVQNEQLAREPQAQAATEAANKRQSSCDDDCQTLRDEERMLVAALPHEYVVTVMRHDGQPLWWWMTHKKLTPEQLTSVLVQVIVGLAVAEHVYLYEHRDLHVSNILIKRTATAMIPFTIDGHNYQIVSHGIKATIIDATFSRLTHNNKVYYRDLTNTLKAYGAKKTPPRMSLQNRSYRQMVRTTRNQWNEFMPKTNLIWLTYLCETLMKNDVMKTNPTLSQEIKKIRDHTAKVKTTLELLSCFPFERCSSKRASNGEKRDRAEK